MTITEAEMNEIEKRAKYRSAKRFYDQKSADIDRLLEWIREHMATKIERRKGIDNTDTLGSPMRYSDGSVSREYEDFSQPVTADSEGDLLNQKPIWQIIAEESAAVPPEAFSSLPADRAEQHDHYIYGTPKRQAEQLSDDELIKIMVKAAQAKKFSGEGMATVLEALRKVADIRRKQ